MSVPANDIVSAVTAALIAAEVANGNIKDEAKRHDYNGPLPVAYVSMPDESGLVASETNPLTLDTTQTLRVELVTDSTDASAVVTDLRALIQAVKLVLFSSGFLFSLGIRKIGRLNVLTRTDSSGARYHAGARMDLEISYHESFATETAAAELKSIFTTLKASTDEDAEIYLYDLLTF